jgi:hypothetical protein
MPAFRNRVARRAGEQEMKRCSPKYLAALGLGLRRVLTGSTVVDEREARNAGLRSPVMEGAELLRAWLAEGGTRRVAIERGGGGV